jgi:hypothetical protein
LFNAKCRPKGRLYKTRFKRSFHNPDAACAIAYPSSQSLLARPPTQRGHQGGPGSRWPERGGLQGCTSSLSARRWYGGSALASIFRTASRGNCWDFCAILLTSNAGRLVDGRRQRANEFPWSSVPKIAGTRANLVTRSGVRRIEDDFYQRIPERCSGGQPPDRSPRCRGIVLDPLSCEELLTPAI